MKVTCYACEECFGFYEVISISDGCYGLDFYCYNCAIQEVEKIKKMDYVIHHHNGEKECVKISLLEAIEKSKYRTIETSQESIYIDEVGYYKIDGGEKSYINNK